jgi:hypothetical protein
VNAVIDMLGVYYPARRGAEQNRKIPIGDPRSIQTGPNGTMGQNGSKWVKIGNNNALGEASMTPPVFFSYRYGTAPPVRTIKIGNKSQHSRTEAPFSIIK